MEQISNKALNRVKKMLAIAHNEGATEQERDTALKMAYNLLAKHNMSMADIPAEASAEAREMQEFTMCGDKWIRDVCHSISDLFFCNYYFVRHGAGKDSHHFIGRQSNAVTAQYMSEFVVRSLQKEARKRYKTPTTPEGRSFCVGATATITRRVFELQTADIQENTTDTADGVPTVGILVDADGKPLIRRTGPKTIPGSALVLANLHETEQAANAKFIADVLCMNIKTEKARATKVKSDAYHDGKDFGKTISLNKQVGGVARSTKQLN